MTPTRFYFHSDDRRVDRVDPNGLYGVDPGDQFAPSDVALDFMKQVHGSRMHFYCVGPGMVSWSSQEAEQIKWLAKMYGYVDTDRSLWLARWNDTGWRKYVWSFFKYYHDTYNAYSIEIDNLDGGLKSTNDYLSYFAKLEDDLRNAGITTKLMMKNVPVDVLRKLLPTAFFAPWAIFEEGTGNMDDQDAECFRLGIRAITPKSGLLDTNHYGVLDAGIASLPFEAEAQTT